MSGIARHTKCRNCGECCGPVFIDENEDKKIRKFLSKVSSEEIERIKKQKKDAVVCEFRDIEKNNCFIYPVRPVICKLFGVTKGMECSYGNTCELDNLKFIRNKKNPKIIKYFK